MKTKKLKRPKITFNWKRKDNATSSAILINGILITCILLSIASGFIDLTFFSGLSKSLFHVGTIPVPAAVLYSIISIGFISGKFWCAMQIGMLKELQTRLEAKGKSWASNLKKARIPWHIAHKFLIAVSIITALSLSVNSIGSGIRTIDTNIKNMSKDAESLIKYEASIEESSKNKTSAAKDNINATKDAQKAAEEEFDKEWKVVEDCRSELATLDQDAEDYESQREAICRKYASRVALDGITWRNISYAQKSTIKNQVLAQNKDFEIIDETQYIEESINFDKTAVNDILNALVDKEYKFPDGKIIEFKDEQGNLVNIQLAISRLQQGIAAWQNDTGDVGESSKVFTLLATYIKADVSAGGMGFSEWMMMVLIALFGIVQEFLIYLFTPKATIDRKLLSQVSHYMKWESEQEKERFLIDVYISYVGDGVINQEQFEAKCRKAVYFMEMTSDDVISKYSLKKKAAAKVSQEKVNDKKIDAKVTFLPNFDKKVNLSEEKVKLSKDEAKLTEERDSDLQKLMDKAKGLL